MDDAFMFSVFGWAADRYGCGYYRIGLPFQEMRGLGIDAFPSVILPERVKDMDLVVGQRVCIEGASDTWQRMAKDGKRLIFEIDDDLWHVHKDNELAGKFFDNPDVTRRLTENLKVAKMATVTTEGLAKVVRTMNPNVSILPNCIDGRLLNHERPRRNRLTVGWAGSATHLRDFQIVVKPLTRYLRNHLNVDMHFVGHTYEQLLKMNCRFTRWVAEVDEYHKTIDFDIGIIPLSMGIFNDSKSYIKALEYAALGIPVIASDYGPYRDFIVHGETGFLVKYERDWITYLNLLTDDEALRDRIGKQAREYASEFTIQKNAHKWIEAYQQALEM